MKLGINIHSTWYTHLDFRRNFARFNRTLGNLYGTDRRKLLGNYRHMNIIGSNGADAASYHLGAITRPEDLDKCASRPEDFLQALDTWQVLNPKQFSAEDAIYNYSSFVRLTSSRMACLLNLQDSYIEIAKVQWALQQMFSALELQLVSCVLDDLRVYRSIRKRRSVSETFRRK